MSKFKTRQIILALCILTNSLFGQELIPLCDQGKCGFKNGIGEISIPLVYDAVGDFHEGYAAVKQNGKWGFINKAGKKIIPLKFDSVDRFSEGLAAIKKNGKWGFITTQGKAICPSKYSAAGAFYNGLAEVSMDKSLPYVWGYDDPIRIKDYQNSIDSSYAKIPREIRTTYTGYIDHSGKERIYYKRIIIDNACLSDTNANRRKYVIEKKYEKIYNYGKWGLLDKTGKEVVPCQFDSTDCLSGKLVSVKLNGKWAFKTISGNDITEFKYDFVELLRWYDVAKVKMKDKWGFLDLKANIVIPIIYDEVGEFEDGTIEVRLNGETFRIDQLGKKVL